MASCDCRLNQLNVNASKGGDIVNLIVHRYEGTVTRWKGYVEPEDRSWILYFDENGRPAAYFAQREESGGVVNDSLMEMS